MLILEMFLYIFNFPLLAGIGSCYLLGAFLGIKLFLSKQYQNMISKMVSKHVIWNIVIWYSILFSLSLLMIVIHETYDMSFTTTLVNQGVQLVIGILLYGDFCLKKKEGSAIEYLLIAFVVQAFIQTVSFISPQINEFLNIFREASVVEIASNQYLGTRGLALVGGGFFSLSAAYAIFFVILVEKRRDIKLGKIVSAIILGVLFFGALSAGRTALVGIAAAIGIMFVENFVDIVKQFKNNGIVINTKLKKRTVIILVLILLVVLVVVLLILNDVLGVSIGEEIQRKINYFIIYAFELFYNLARGDGFTTSSTATLSNMYFEVPVSTFFFGDGWYTTASGSYYMGTDAGYMRNILFFGIIGFFCLLVYQIQFFSYKQNSSRRFVSIILIALLLVLHIKGDVIGFLQITQRMLLIRALAETMDGNYLKGKNKYVCKENYGKYMLHNI